MESTMMLSKLGNLDAAESTELLTATLNGFQMEASEAVDVVSKLVAIKCLSQRTVMFGSN